MLSSMYEPQISMNMGLPSWLSQYKISLQCRRPVLDPWVRKISWRRACNPSQYSCLENSMGRGAWRATVHGVTESNTTEQLHTHKHTHTHLLPLKRMRTSGSL